jgi:hypothetical protein
MLGFVIPLRHPASSRNWAIVVERLTETLRSVHACAAGGKAFTVLVVNREAEIPALPETVTVVRVGYPPPPVSVFYGEVEDSVRKEALHTDKGLKVAAGMIRARDLGARYVMAVDADDVVSSRLPDFVAARAGEPGWYVTRGWLLPVGSRVGLLLKDFDQWCGTCMITRIDLLRLGSDPEEMDPAIIRRWFGHHRDLVPDLRAQGYEIRPVPFPAAIYRIGHTESNYGRGSLIKEVFAPRKILRSPGRVLRRVLRLHWLGEHRLAEFHGGAGLN